MLLHSHSTERTHVNDQLASLGSVLMGNSTGSSARFARSLASCVKEIINKNDVRRSPSLSLVDDSFLSSTMDDDVVRSLNWTLRREYQKQLETFKFLSKPVINKHDYPYIHNPKDTCLNRKIDVVFAVVSAPENFDNRMKSRQGLKGSYSFVQNNNATLLFFTGRSNHHNKSRKFQVGINMEMRRFGDIVQEDFLDEYKNLTLKSVSVLKWVSVYCPHAKFLVKSDDNIGVKPSATLESLMRHRQRFGNFILGRWNTMNIVQRKAGAKNYVSFKEYPYKTFPPHVLGRAMGFPVSTAKLLYQATLRVRPFPIDDVYISGICAPLVSVPVMKDMAFDYIVNSW